VEVEESLPVALSDGGRKEVPQQAGAVVWFDGLLGTQGAKEGEAVVGSQG